MGYTLLENSYIEKVSDFGKEILLEWVASRKVNDYFKYVIKSSWQILGLNPAEIEEGGKKIETNKGELKMKVKGSLVRDYGGRWKKKSLFGPLRNMYEGYVIRKNIDEYEERAYEEVDQFVNELKEHLGLEGKE